MENLLPSLLGKIPVEVAIIIIAILMLLMFSHFTKRINKKKEMMEEYKKYMDNKIDALRNETYTQFLKPHTFNNQCHETMANERVHVMGLIIASAKEISTAMKEDMTEFKKDFKTDITELRTQMLLKLDKLNGMR